MNPLALELVCNFLTNEAVGACAIKDLKDVATLSHANKEASNNCRLFVQTRAPGAKAREALLDELWGHINWKIEHYMVFFDRVAGGGFFWHDPFTGERYFDRMGVDLLNHKVLQRGGWRPIAITRSVSEVLHQPIYKPHGR